MDPGDRRAIGPVNPQLTRTKAMPRKSARFKRPSRP